MMITTRLKLLLFVSLFLTTTILMAFAALKQQQESNLHQLSHITQLQATIDLLRSRLWVLQEFQDKDALAQTKAVHTRLKKELNQASFIGTKAKVLSTNLDRMADSLGALLQLAEKHINPPPQQGITSAKGMLTARFNISIQAMSEDLTLLGRSVILNMGQRQAEILTSTVLILLAGSVILLLFTTSTLKTFKQSLHALTSGISRLSKGKLDTNIYIAHKNELADLAAQFNVMTQKLNDTTIKKEALQSEVESQTRQLKQQTKKLQYVAEHDDLTELYSRSAFERQIDTALARCQRTQSHAAMLFIDLDRFKLINDTLGHDIGDKVLQTAAKRIQSAVRSSDICGRLGGDEFVVWLEPINDIDEVEIVINKIIAHLSPNISCGHSPVTLTASIGVAMLPIDDTSRLGLIKMADNNMYQAKKVEGNSYCFSQTISPHTHSSEQQELG